MSAVTVPVPDDAPVPPPATGSASGDLLDDLSWRGLIAGATDLDALREHLAAGPVTLYCGFDPTAPSLHHGNLLQLLTLRRFQDAGHRPIGLVGGATGLVGDPRPGSERTLNSPDLVAQWAQRLRGQVGLLLSFDGPNAALLVNNLDWTQGLSAIALLRDIGRHFRVGKMIAKEAVSARLNSDLGISYTEFSYQVLQAMDFLELFRRYGCTLQTGGSDQWGNLTAGLDLVHRVEGATVHALATTLITKSDGTKFGKTAGGAIWLDPQLLSPYAFYQFWLGADDADAPRLLRAYSLRPRTEIEELERAVQERPAARAAQRALAEELTTLVHGDEECRRVIGASRALFGQADLEALDEGALAAALAETPGTTLATDEAAPSVAELLVRTGLVASLSAARRTVAEGGAYVNNTRVQDADAPPTPEAWLHGRQLVLRRGKRQVAGVRR